MPGLAPIVKICFPMGESIMRRLISCVAILSVLAGCAVNREGRPIEKTTSEPAAAVPATLWA